MKFAENVPLAPYTTFRIGGPARWFAEAATEEDVAEAVRFAREGNLPLFVLGGGSNLLVADSGFPGLALHIALRGIAVSRDGEKAVFSAAAGEEWDGLAARAVQEGYAGVECLSGIPGSVGGTPVQNVGAYGQEVSETIVSVRVLDRSNHAFVTLANSECGFGYRKSILNTTERDRYIVTRVDYALDRNRAPAIRYRDLEAYLKGRKPTLPLVREAVLAIRARKGMVIVPGEADSRSAGSFFKNPLVPLAALGRIAAASGVAPELVPHYPDGKGSMKVPAAWLVEHAGFARGYVLGEAGISSRHTLALINRGHATAVGILALRDRIVEGVRGRFGVELEPEPVWVGAQQ